MLGSSSGADASAGRVISADMGTPSAGGVCGWWVGEAPATHCDAGHVAFITKKLYLWMFYLARGFFGKPLREGGWVNESVT